MSRSAHVSFYLSLLMLSYSAVVLATTWSDHEVDDPFANAKCKVSSPMSSGSYIYQWPSKMDGVYWPHTTFRWIWHCPASGYTSFGDDFASLTEAERERIGKFLNTSGHGKLLHGDAAQLLLLEAIYKLRDKDDQFWGWFLRVKANLYENLAQASRYASMPHLQAKVASDSSDFAKLQSAFVLGRYQLMFGDEARAKALFAQARTMPWIDDEGNTHVGSQYISALIDELQDCKSHQDDPLC